MPHSRIQHATVSAVSIALRKPIQDQALAAIIISRVEVCIGMVLTDESIVLSIVKTMRPDFYPLSELTRVNTLAAWPTKSAEEKLMLERNVPLNLNGIVAVEGAVRVDMATCNLCKAPGGTSDVAQILIVQVLEYLVDEFRW